MRLSTLALGLYLAGFAPLAGAAEPILLPDFTPSSQAEFTATVMIQGMVSDRLLSDGYIVLTPEVVAPLVDRSQLANCAAQPSCPGAVLPKLPTRVAVVVRVSRLPVGLSAHMELYEQSRPTPVIASDIALPPGSEGLLVEEISRGVAWLVQQIGPSPEPVLMAAARLIAGQDASAAPPPNPVPAPIPVPPPIPRPVPQPAPQPVDQPAPPPRPTTIVDIDGDPGRPGRTPKPASTSQAGALGAETGVFPRHVAGSEQHWRDSGMDPRDWQFKYMPHAGRVFFEVRAGLAIGDVDRSADLRVEVLNPANEVGQSFYQEGPQKANRPRGAIFVGYAPTTFFDFGVLGGLQYGQRRVTTGYARLHPEDPAAAPTVVSDAFDGVDAVQLYIQPRIRGYLVPLGPAKPFLFTGGDVRIFNAYELQQPDQWSYPLPPAAMIGGWVGGGGMMFDPSPIVGFFFEASYTQHFGSRAEAVITGPWIYENLVAPTGTGYTLATMGGIQFRI